MGIANRPALRWFQKSGLNQMISNEINRASLYQDTFPRERYMARSSLD